MAVDSTARRTLRPFKQYTGFDTAVLTILIVLLVAIPATLVFAPLGAAGTPGEIFGMAMLALWAFRRISSSARTGVRGNVIRIALIVFVLSVLCSYLVAATRPISALELNAADRGVLSTLAWLGMALFTMDAVASLDHLNTILRRLTIAGAIEACVGIVQLFTHLPLINLVQIPGLNESSDLAAEITTRGAQTRPPGTTTHPIEFGAVLTMILPLAIYFALTDTHRGRVQRWAPVFLIAFAIPMSISRTAFISAAGALIVLLPTLSTHVRRRVYAGIVGVVGCVYLTVPGLLGTIQNLFTGISDDSSAGSRAGSYDLAGSVLGNSPIFGRGLSTFLPDYRIFDNQLLLTTVECGLVGLAALLALLITPIVATLQLRRRIGDPRARQLAGALAAGIAAAACSFAFYDALAFRMGTSILFVLIGAAGCLLRLSRHPANAADLGVEVPTPQSATP